MIIDNSLVLGILGSLTTIIVAIIGVIQYRGSKKQEKVAETNRKIGETRFELDVAKVKNDKAHDMLSRQTAKVVSGAADKQTLHVLIEAADNSAKEFAEREEALNTEMRRLYSK